MAHWTEGHSRATDPKSAVSPGQKPLTASLATGAKVQDPSFPANVRLFTTGESCRPPAWSSLPVSVWASSRGRARFRRTLEMASVSLVLHRGKERGALTSSPS